MSQENVETVEAIYNAWKSGVSAREFIHPELEYVNPPDAVEPGTRVGRRNLARIRDVYDGVEVRPYRVLDAGDDVVVLATLAGTSRGAGVPVDIDQGYVWTIRDGQAVRFRWFRTPQEALEAVGLRE
jgi:ketosteroid isomerase-like protein